MTEFLKKWRWELLSPLAGVLLTLAFAPYHFSYLALVSLAIVFWSWLDCTPLRAGLRAYLFGLGLFGSGISWVYISIHDFGGAPVVGAVLLTLLVVFFWSLFPALTGYLSVKIFAKKYKNKLIWVFPFIWILIEYYRGYWLLNGFPWLQVAYTQIETPLKGFVPVIGVYGTGLLLALSASLIVTALTKSVKYRYVVLCLLLIWGSGLYLQTIKWTQKAGDAISVALIQGNVSQDQKWLLDNRVKTLRRYHQLTTQNWDADVIIWPETAIPAYLSQVKENYLDPLSAEAKAHDTDLIVSLPASNEQHQHFNTVLTLGKNEGRYDKNHLLPFGEYLPLQPVSGFILESLNIHLGNFTSGGDTQPLLKAGGYSFNTSICYEDAFASEAKRGQPEAAFLVNVTNDAWFGDSLEPHQHMQIAQMRALETGRYLLRTTNTGVTAIVAPDGTIVSKLPMFKQAVLRGNIHPMEGLTVYARLEDEMIILVLIILLIVICIFPISGGLKKDNDRRYE